MLEHTQKQTVKERERERLLQNVVESLQITHNFRKQVQYCECDVTLATSLPPGVVLNIVPPGVVEYSWGMWAESCTATRRTAGMFRLLLLWLPAADMLTPS